VSVCAVPGQAKGQATIGSRTASGLLKRIREQLVLQSARSIREIFSLWIPTKRFRIYGRGPSTYLSINGYLVELLRLNTPVPYAIRADV